MKKIFMIMMASVLALSASAQIKVTEVENVSTADLLGWKFYGIGYTANAYNQFLISESADSKGVMVVSPTSYGENVIMKYKILPLTPATVIVNLLSYTDKGEATTLTFPENFDGAMAPIIGGDTYFFAFKNDPHNVTPFLRKYPDDKILFQSKTPDTIVPGKYSDVEVGQQGGKLWLKIDGQTVLETTDPAYHKGGYISIRVRGIQDYPAGALIKDLSIERF